MDEPFGILQTLRLNTGEVTSCDTGGHCLLAIGSSDKSVRVLEWKVGLGYVDMFYSPLPPHRYGVTSVRFSPKGTMLVSSGLDGIAVLYNVKTGSVINTFVQANKSSIRYCEFTPDSTKLITAGDNGVFCFWDLFNLDQVRSFQLHDTEDFSLRGLSISPDSQYLLSADSGVSVKLWFIGVVDEDQPQCLFWKKNIHDGLLHCEFSSKREITGGPVLKFNYFLATCGADSLIKVWSFLVIKNIFNNGPEHITCEINTIHSLKGHINDVLTIRFNLDGTYLASTGLDNTIKIWQVESGKCLKTLYGHTRLGTCCAFFKNSELLATGSNDKTVIIWDLKDRYSINDQLLQPCDVSSHFTNADSFNYCFDKLYTKEDKRNHKFKVLHTFNSSSPCNTVHFFGNGILAAAGGEKTIIVWEKRQGTSIFEEKEKLKNHKYSINHLEVSPCGNKIISCSLDGVLIFWDLNSGLSHEMETSACTSGLRTCRFSPDSKFIATAGDDQKVFLWDADNLEFMKIIQSHNNSITSIAFTPDCKFLASTCCAGEINVYDFENDQNCANIKNAHDLGVMCCDFSITSTFNGSKIDLFEDFKKIYLLATCGNDSLVKLWMLEMNSEMHLSKVLHGHGGTVTYVRFSPSEPFLLASCAADTTIRIWNAKSGQCLHVLNFHQSTVTTCSFSQDSSMLATGSLDKSVLILSFPEKICPQPIDMIKCYCKPLENWNASDIAYWLIDIGYPNAAEKVKFTSLNGRQILSLMHDSVVDLISSDSENEREEISLQLYWLRREYTRNTSNIGKIGKNFPHKFLCPITHEIMKNPVTCSDGYTYERAAIIEWFISNNSLSPVTNELLRSREFRLNFTLRKSIYKFLYGNKIEK